MPEMPKINFLGAFMRHYDGRMDKNGADSVVLHMSCDLTSALAEKLGCEDALQFESVKVKPVALSVAEIHITDILLIAQIQESDYPLEIIARTAKDFELVRHEEEGVIERELRFKIVAPGETVALVQSYWSKIGAGKGQLTVTSMEQAPAGEQQTL